MSTLSKQTCNVEIESQEAKRTTGSSWKVLSAIGVVKMMLKEPDTMGDSAGRMAQRAQHTATRNKSKWLDTRRVSTSSAETRQTTYLDHPSHFPITTDDPVPTQTRGHHVIEDDSKQTLLEDVSLHTD